MRRAPLDDDNKRADDWTYLSNGHLRLGVKKSSGACLGHLSTGPSGRNLLNHFDQGRFVQQSYYGDSDGSHWVRKPWRYNPVQGGDYRGQASVLREFRADKTALYAKVTPRNWAGGELLPEVTLEEWVELKGRLAHIRFKLSYAGKRTHGARHQEIPAVFVEPDLTRLATYEGTRPWTNEPVVRKQPGWPNQSQKMAENWVAYVDDQDKGVGVYVPIASEATCYRFKGGAGSDCSYVAPLTTFALTPGVVFAYDLYLTLGSTDEIRARFRQLHRTARAMRQAGNIL